MVGLFCPTIFYTIYKIENYLFLYPETKFINCLINNTCYS
ncbi:hypothetical protein EZS27_000857 [termite gut metagenome]|uniref:Uncharacterized protein n=1 Tax=termite gut metagenome TaxID=433724 RepID=A0A5J4T1F3_9ZZZZ